MTQEYTPSTPTFVGGLADVTLHLRGGQSITFRTDEYDASVDDESGELEIFAFSYPPRSVDLPSRLIHVRTEAIDAITHVDVAAPSTEA
ncbi:hypothetical protein Psed_0013 [Pseudonocardia dioxanivorans CB1190]|uniref:Uncharacterized protein n=1 Tax=Pseudonocardia dioxanivorans (strain ATCC 55486 / DSM 44775 / JCM 13855 / CB1190) TaxID=675635 RepID=F4CK75_PSEUX|nr:hypothetical protein [Pseudonocardia dioxanivorans]AEA22298.1 hypothetical protein Psed_0013 [Pseudonocardia dioxanivorans CB1190]